MPSAYIVAAQPALRAGLRAMLDVAGVDVAGESAGLPARDAADVIVAAGQIGGEELAGLDELGVAVVLLTDDGTTAAALRGLALPGWAALLADATAEQIVAAVNAVAQGLAVLPAGSASALAPRSPVEVSDPLQESLTPRELEVLALLSQGLSNKLIARKLQISEHTVKFHVSSTYAKLGAASRTEAVSLAARRGLISL
jgi:DNA-binding NarL/FixJ family response regulator